jgi:5'-3' exonuclease
MNIHEVKNTTIQDFDNKISEVIDTTLPKEDKVLLWDFDSMFYYCLHSGNDELGNKNPEYTIDDLDFLQGKLDEMVLKHLTEIETYFNIIATYIFVAGKDNFRKKLYPEYKANRPDKHELIPKLYEYAHLRHNVIFSDGYEAEDYVATLSAKLKDKAIIAYVDHDLLELPSIFYNYSKLTWSKITEEEAKHNLYKKLCLSEPGDNVKTTPGIGIKYFEKHFQIGMTDEEYEEALFAAYMKAWKNNEDKAIEQLALAKSVLCLKTDIDSLT